MLTREGIFMEKIRLGILDNMYNIFPPAPRSNSFSIGFVFALQHKGRLVNDPIIGAEISQDIGNFIIHEGTL